MVARHRGRPETRKPNRKVVMAARHADHRHTGTMDKKLLRIIAVTSFFRGEMSRERILAAMEFPLVDSLASDHPGNFEWRFDLEAGAAVLALLKRIAPLDERLQRMGAPTDMQGKFLLGWKINVVQTDGFRVEIVEYEVKHA
jgi:hypothetical protein